MLLGIVTTSEKEHSRSAMERKHTSTTALRGAIRPSLLIAARAHGNVILSRHQMGSDTSGRSEKEFPFTSHPVRSDFQAVPES